MNILILIPARKGSKRIVNKNLKELGGKPLIQWTIEIAKRIDPKFDVLVSTDSTEICELSLKLDVLCPWMRPEELSTDTSSSVDVALHAIQWYEESIKKIDGLLLLQPTSPFRDLEELKVGVKLFQKNHHSSVVGVSPAQNHPQWTFRIKEGVLNPFLNFDGIQRRSQDLEPAYSINGSFYLISPANLLKNRSFFDENTLALISQKETASVDIDTQDDWDFAEYLIKNGKVK